MPSHPAWRSQVRYLGDDEPITAATIGRPDVDLALRDGYLKARIDDAELGEAIVARGVAVDPATQVGEAVYWDAARNRFGRGLAAAATNGGTGLVEAAASSQVLGVCGAKLDAADAADLVLGGRIRIPPATGGDEAVQPGRYYLSPSWPGKLTRTRPTAGLPVLFYDGDWSYVQPQIQGLLDTHVHRTFDLVCQVAGTSTLIDHVHHVDADPDQPGWLPANHSIFAGKAPAAAVFGYNLARHPALQAIWPPVPLAGVTLYWDYARNLGGGLLLPAGPGGAYVADAAGIWWLSACYGDVPWPEPPDLATPPVEGSSYGFGSCPRGEAMRLVLACIDSAGGGVGLVNSVRPRAGAPLRVLDEAGHAATQGDLLLDIDWTAGVTYDAAETAGVAVKRLDDTGHFRAGPAVAGVAAGAGVAVTGGSPVVVAGTTYRGGLVTVAATATAVHRELPLQLVRFQDAEEWFLDAYGVPYVALPPGRASAIVARFDVPRDDFPSGGTIAAHLAGVVYTGTTGTMPALTVTRRVLPWPAAGSPVVVGDTVAAAWSLPIAGTHAAGTARSVTTTTSLTVAAGDTVLVTLARAAADGFGGEVGFLRLSLLLDAGV